MQFRNSWLIYTIINLHLRLIIILGLSWLVNRVCSNFFMLAVKVLHQFHLFHLFFGTRSDPCFAEHHIHSIHETASQRRISSTNNSWSHTSKTLVKLLNLENHHMFICSIKFHLMLPRFYFSNMQKYRKPQPNMQKRWSNIMEIYSTCEHWCAN